MNASDICTYNLSNADVTYYPHFLPQELAESLFHTFLKELDWKQLDIKIFGKVIPQPRLTALYSINNEPYSYSNLTLHPNSYTAELEIISNKLIKLTGIKFTHCLANLYRNGADSMGWHSDNEKELGKNPVIASISLGAERKFQLKHKKLKEEKLDISLKHGSLLIMKGETQHFWKHQLPKTKKINAPRINLTFRTIF